MATVRIASSPRDFPICTAPPAAGAYPVPFPWVSLGAEEDLLAAAAETPTRSIRHCTQTGRWVVPFRAIWCAGGDAIVCGGMKRTCEVFDAASGKRLASLSSEHMTAIPSRNAVHADGSAIACATNSGRVHLYEAAAS